MTSYFLLSLEPSQDLSCLLIRSVFLLLLLLCKFRPQLGRHAVRGDAALDAAAHHQRLVVECLHPAFGRGP